MEEIDKIHLTKTLKRMREAQIEIKRAKLDNPEVIRVRLEIERAIQHLALILAKEL